MYGRLVTTLVTALAVALLLVGPPEFSTAAYTSRSTTTASVTAAADWTPPTVALRTPGTTVGATVTLTAEASDAGSGVRSVTFEHRQAGAWVVLCADATRPYECAWDTAALADGPHDLRAEAVDNAGYSTTSATVPTVVANHVEVALTAPATDVRGTVPLTATLQTAPAGWSVRIEYAVADSTSWLPVCTRATAPYACSWVTDGLSGQEYDLRAVAFWGTTTVVSDVVEDVTVDNTAPVVTMLDPGSPMRGTVTFAAKASDSGSGVDTVAIQYAAAGTSTYRELCTVVDEPWSCSHRTTQLVDGTYTFRAVATDVAGNATTSSAVGGRVVDNTVTSVSVIDPGAHLRGVVTVQVAVESTAGVASVRLQRAASGTTAWSDLCLVATAPYGCDWNTATVADGLYDLRAVVVDKAGRATTSALLTGRRVDNSPLRGADVQTTNGGKVAGRLDAGDKITYTFSQQVRPSTVATGWNGAATAVTLRLRDGLLVGGSSKGDEFDVLRGGSAVNLGSLALKENFVGPWATTLLTATMTLGTTTVNGATVSTVTLTAGAIIVGGVRTVNRASTTVWSPSSVVTDLTGRSCSNAPVTESGPSDREL
jgi:hypothetical protein